ncbi:hypothetical protein JCM5353_001014 [Sporobolomyces roseus]
MDLDVIDPSQLTISHGTQDKPDVALPDPEPLDNINSSQDVGEESRSLPVKRKRRSTGYIDGDDDYSLQTRKRTPRSSNPTLAAPTGSLQYQIATLVLSQVATNSTEEVDWSVIGTQLVGLRQNARQLQALWKKWKEELHRNGSYAELRWTTQEDDCLRSSINETGAIGDEGIYKADNADENIAKWVLVRDRLGEKNEECLGSIVRRWNFMESARSSEVIKEVGKDSMDVEQNNGEEQEGIAMPNSQRDTSKKSDESASPGPDQAEVSFEALESTNKNQDSLSRNLTTTASSLPLDLPPPSKSSAEAGQSTARQSTESYEVKSSTGEDLSPKVDQSASSTTAKARKFTSEEDSQIRQLKADGISNQNIADLLGRAKSSIRGRWSRLESGDLRQPLSAQATTQATPRTLSPAPCLTIAPNLPPVSSDSSTLELSSALKPSAPSDSTEVGGPAAASGSSSIAWQRPVGHSSFYSALEDAKLCELLGEGKTHKEIANALTRSTVSVGTRITKLRAKGVLQPSKSTPHAVYGNTKGQSPSPASASLLNFASSNPTTSASANSSTPPVSIDQVPFSPEDDRLILKLYVTLPGQFKKISRQMQPTRHKKEVRERYEELISQRERSSSPDSSSDDNRSSRQTPRSNTVTSSKSRLSISTTGTTEDKLSTSADDKHRQGSTTQMDSRRASIIASNEIPSVAHSPPVASSSRFGGNHESSQPPILLPSISPKRRLVDASTETNPLPSPRPRKRRNDFNGFRQASQSRKLPALTYEHLLEPAIAALKGFHDFGGGGGGEGREKAKGSEGVTGQEAPLF